MFFFQTEWSTCADYRSGGLFTHKRASVRWVEDQLDSSLGLSSWWMRWGTWTREHTPAPPTTCKEPNLCPQTLKWSPKPNQRNPDPSTRDNNREKQRESESEGERWYQVLHFSVTEVASILSTTYENIITRKHIFFLTVINENKLQHYNENRVCCLDECM